MADNPRIEELKRRVQKDPASIAFAQLAEEHRRAGEYQEAIAVCRSGLEQHPGYLSARVTLGRALLETGAYDDAQAELEYVLRAAPDNLAAIRALAEIHQRREETGEPLPRPETFVPDSAPALDDALDLAFHEAMRLADLQRPHFEPVIADAGSPLPEDRPDPALAALESWLSAILADRDARRLHGAP